VGDQGSDIARIAAIAAGLPDTVAGVQENRFCASGLEAVNMAAAKVRSGWEDLVLAGGVESMSRVKMGSDGGAWFNDPMTNLATDFVPQGIGADLIATIEGFSRRDVDEYAALSQERAATAWKENRFDRSVVPVRDRSGLVVLDRDEHLRPGTTADSLAGLKPSFADIGELGGFDAARGRSVAGAGACRAVACGRAGRTTGRARSRRRALLAIAETGSGGVAGGIAARIRSPGVLARERRALNRG
ncbi:beta-ketoacyl synthase N-terminal-like domain-containing protein, partial [Streptomyces sp. WAC08241]|uniref:thiolase family protein n=1 Tax=Streptomyces sp. WAC08241 TaxID=2487421 RepID=UPI0028AFDAA9